MKKKPTVRKARGAASSRQKTGAARPLTIRDVARRARVSVATVSRVLNEPDHVREKNRLRVQKTMQELGFVPNFTATSLAKNRSGGIGLVIPNTGPMFALLLDEIERAVRQEGSHLVVAIGNCEGDHIPDAIQFLKQRRCDSLIVFPGSMNDARVTAIMDSEPNIVAVFRDVRKHRNRCVLVDNRAGARMATQYLIHSGHRDIAIITADASNHESNLRYDAFVSAMNEAKLAIDPGLVARGDFSPASGERAVAQLLAHYRPFSALFCFNDEMAAGAISYLRSAGFSLPEDISVVGFDDVPYCNQIHPRLTTVQQPVTEIARTAARLALSLRNGATSTEGPSVLVPKLIVRESVIPHRKAAAETIVAQTIPTS